MQDLKLVLSKYIVKRRLEGGEFSYVYRLQDLTVTGKKPVLGLLKKDAKVYSKLKEESEIADEEELDTQVLKIIPLLPYEDAAPPVVKVEKEEAMETDDADNKDDGDFDFSKKIMVPFDEYRRTVHVRFNIRVTPEEGETFLRGIDSDVVIKRMGEKGWKKKLTFYRLTFATDEKAKEFCEREDIFKESSVDKITHRNQCLRKKLHILITRESDRNKIRIASWLERKNSNLDNFLFFWSNDNEKKDKIMPKLGNLKSLKKIMSSGDKNNEKGFLVEYPDKESAEKVHLELLEGKEYIIISAADYKAHLDLVEKPNNLGQYGADPERKIVVVQHMDVAIVRNMFPAAVSVARVRSGAGAGHLAVVEFSSAAEAAEADLASAGLNAVSHMLMTDYFVMRKLVLDMPLSVLKRRNLAVGAEVNVKEDDNSITVINEEKATSVPQKKKTVETVETKKTNTKDKSKMKHVQTQTQQDNKLINSRKYQVGKSDWDPFVVVSNIRPKNQSLGIPNDMDICNYFIHNHKNVVDVKFPPRGDGKTVIVKFNSKEAADTFIELDYIMFFGTELTRNIVGQYLKGKTLDQKNEISMLLLGKKYVFGTFQDEGNPFYVELSGLSTKSEDLREMFISQLNLAEKDVGKTIWEPAAGNKMNARLNLKVPEATVNHLITKWNSMDVNVDGQNVSAEFWVSKGTKRHGDLLSKKAKKKLKNKNQ